MGEDELIINDELNLDNPADESVFSKERAVTITKKVEIPDFLKRDVAEIKGLPKEKIISIDGGLPLPNGTFFGILSFVGGVKFTMKGEEYGMLLISVIPTDEKGKYLDVIEEKDGEFKFTVANEPKTFFASVNEKLTKSLVNSVGKPLSIWMKFTCKTTYNKDKDRYYSKIRKMEKL